MVLPDTQWVCLAQIEQDTGHGCMCKRKSKGGRSGSLSLSSSASGATSIYIDHLVPQRRLSLIHPSTSSSLAIAYA